MARKSRKGIENTVPQVIKPSFYAGAYVRLSVVDKKKKGDSIESQQAIINAYIDECPGIELTEVYIDNGLTGQTFERPAFQRMLDDMDKGKINCCVTKDLSRLGRNAIDTGFYIEKYFPTRNIRYIAINDNYDSADNNSGGIMVGLKNMINEAYALDISRKIKATLQMNINNGLFIGSMAPYGYLKSKEDCHKLVVDEYAAGIVRRIFEMTANGDRPNKILEWLNGDGILTPSHYLHSIGQASAKQKGEHIHWSFRAVRSIIDNRMYCGDMVQGKRRMVGHINKKLPESEWVVIENTHEAIISRELYAIAHELWKKPDNPPEPYYKTPNTENCFPGKVFCGDCGFTMNRKRGGEKYNRYICNSRKLYSGHACGGMKISETMLKQQVLRLIRKHEPCLGQVKTTTVDTVSARDGLESELTRVNADLNKCEKYLKGLYESLILGDITDSEYKEFKTGYENKIASLKERVKQLRLNAHLRSQEDEAISKARESVSAVNDISELNAEDIDRLIERIKVYRNGRIVVKFRLFDEEISSEEGAGDE